MAAIPLNPGSMGLGPGTGGETVRPVELGVIGELGREFEGVTGDKLLEESEVPLEGRLSGGRELSLKKKLVS
jgi:hypothetical protein